MTAILNLSRRSFLLGSASVGGGLILGFIAPVGHARTAQQRLGGWIRIGADERVTIFVEKTEMGQGIHTALAMLVAEELDVEWPDVRVEFPVFEGEQRNVVTAGSNSIRSGWEPMRRAGAAAREMLISAAAETWQVAPGGCRADRGRVDHVASGRSLSYSELVERAASMSVPDPISLKPRDEHRLVGRSMPRLDVPEKVDGTAIFGIDVAVPGMLHAAIEMSPAIGGRIAGLDRDAAVAVPGVRSVVELPGAVAVVADHYWQARRGLESAKPSFTEGSTHTDSEQYIAALREAVDRPGLVAHRTGDPEAELEATERLYEARYEVPFLAHATMEPMNCTCSFGDGSCEVWAPTQSPSRVRQDISEALALPAQRVRVHTTQVGGGFGRRYESDFAVQAARISRSVRRPVKLIWSREEDIRHDYYRPAYAARLRAALDVRGLPVAWSHQIAGPSVAARGAQPWLKQLTAWVQKGSGGEIVPGAIPDPIRRRLPFWIRDGADWMAVQGARPSHYEIDHQRIGHVFVPCDVPTGWWRSVGSSQNAFFIESFVDELSHRAQMDPLEFRRELLSSKPHELRVLERAAALANWGSPLAPGRGRGIGFYPSSGSIVCQVAEVLVTDAAAIRVVHVSCVVDCGVAVNPDTIRAQMEGSMVFGLSAALFGRVDFRAGVVRQGNFDDYRILSLAETPEFEVEIIGSDARPGGVGEPGTPPIAPAVANAVFAATGQRLRSLPLAGQLTRS